MKILSLFDGMACGMLAMIKADVFVEKYAAYETDKFAVQTSSHNFPRIEHKGDVFKGDFTEYKGFDFLIGGSPCTYWSIAQSSEKRETTASGMGWELFKQYIRALKEAEPKFFIYENNKSMSKEIRASITEAFGFEPVYINSALVSAQNRQRLYWVGKRNVDGTYSKVDVKQPEDKGILLKDILENNGQTWLNKSHCIDAHYAKGGNYANPKSQAGQRNMVAEPVNLTSDGKSQCLRASYYKDGIRNMVGNDVDKKTCVAEPLAFSMVGDLDNRSVGTKEKSYCLAANPSSDMQAKVIEPLRIGSFPRPNGELSTSQAMRVYSIDGKSVNICSGSGGMGGKTGLYAIPVEFRNNMPTKAISCADGKTYPVYEVKNGKMTFKEKQYPIKLADGFYIIRKLTVRECMRLQTVPEWYKFPVSDTQAYKMLGNGWTIDVIAHLINSIKDEAEK